MTDIGGLIEFLNGCEQWLDDEGVLQGQREPRFKQAADALATQAKSIENFMRDLAAQQKEIEEQDMGGKPYCRPVKSTTMDIKPDNVPNSEQPEQEGEITECVHGVAMGFTCEACLDTSRLVALRRRLQMEPYLNSTLTVYQIREIIDGDGVLTDTPLAASGGCVECNHYFAQDGICIYCHAPLEGEIWRGNGPCAYCGTLYGEPHYPSCDRPSVYRNAPQAASGGGEEPHPLIAQAYRYAEEPWLHQDNWHDLMVALANLATDLIKPSPTPEQRGQDDGTGDLALQTVEFDNRTTYSSGDVQPRLAPPKAQASEGE